MGGGGQREPGYKKVAFVLRNYVTIITKTKNKEIGGLHEGFGIYKRTGKGLIQTSFTRDGGAPGMDQAQPP